jgi:hypothetical protein
VLAGFAHLEVIIFDFHQLYACFHQSACGHFDHEPGEDIVYQYLSFAIPIITLHHSESVHEPREHSVDQIVFER